MANRIIVALIAVIAIVQSVATIDSQGVLPLLLVLLGLVYAAMAIDAEDATDYLALAIAVGLASQADVLNNIHAIGGVLDGIVDEASTALYAGAVFVLAKRTLNRLMG